MRKFTAYCLATVLATATCETWAGPSTPDMVSGEASTARAALPAALSSAAPTFESLQPPSALLIDGVTDDLFLESTDLSPNGPHPMIPLPPAVWAGFAGLAFVARRVLRRRP